MTNAVSELVTAPTLIKPGSWVRRAACSDHNALFDDPKRATEAMGVCAECPVLADCRAWALRHAVDGVAGGLTAAARRRWRKDNRVKEPTLSAADFLPLDVTIKDTASGPASRSEAILTAVAEWTRQGETQRQIATRLSCTTRQVARLRTIQRRRSIGPA